MKRTLLILACCLLAAACTNNYVVNGSFAEEATVSDGAFVCIVDPGTGVADTCQVVDRKFHFEGPACDTIILAILSSDGYNTQIFPEKGKINVVLGDPSVASGTPLNDRFAEFNNALEALFKAEEERAEDENYEGDNDSLYGEYMDLCKETFKDNMDNMVGLFALRNCIYELNFDDIEDLLEDAPASVLADRRIASVYNAKKVEKETAEGSMFKDFEGKTPGGDPVKLSDYVGKGKAVLVDFWAPWCGPCKQEIPFIKAVYDEFNGDDFTVLGICVWDRDGFSKEDIIAEYGMEWDQIYAFDDKIPTDTYGIVGIPHIILFGPDGTIVKRDIRGEELKPAVEEVLAK